jgi:acetylornithine deacetylase/succinyl-diaminopimelate desuccinylase-like protein
MIRNQCVNDCTAESGQEERNADTLVNFIEGAGLDVEVYDAAPSRRSMVARIEGSDPDAPSLCLMGHTDVVPVNPDGWSRDPFGGELVDGEVWGRGAVDMLNLTSSMAVAFRHLATTGFRPKGDLIYFGVADEESGSAYGAQWMADNYPDAIRADYVLTENGGLHGGPSHSPSVSMNVGEKGVAWRRVRVHGTPGHGSTPFRSDNALVRAAAVVQRIADYRPPARFHEHWGTQVANMDIDDETKAIMLDRNKIDDYLESFPHRGAAAHLWSCCHTTMSPNVVAADHIMKTNVIPDSIDLNIDVRTMPGDHTDEVNEHLQAALGDLYDAVDVEIIMNDPASLSPTDTPLWDSIQRAVGKPFPACRLRHNSSSDSPTPGCTAIWGQSPMAQGYSARRCRPESSAHDSMGTTNESMSKVSSCQPTSGSMSPKISSADSPERFRPNPLSYFCTIHDLNMVKSPVI